MIPVLDTLIENLVGRLVDAGIGKIVSILNVKSDMVALRRNIENIRPVLVNAKSKKIEDVTIKCWFARLQEVVYDVEDLVDDFAAAELDKSKSGKDTILRIPRPFRGKNNSSTSESVKDTALCTPWPFRSVKDIILSFPGVSQMNKVYLKNEISTRIKNINSNLTKIHSEAPTLQLLASLPDADNKVSSLITRTSSYQVESEIVGIDDDATDLVDRITGDSNRAHSLFAITGMPGIGKTTLARKVFNHKLIKKHFDNNGVWVCVSRNYSGEELLKEIVRSILKKDYSESRVSLNELVSKLIEVVKEKRVFIVLDDIWDSHVWDTFLGVPLREGAKYSRILITTRNLEVAKKIKYVRHTHLMKKMNPSDGWLMLCKIVFDEDDMGDMNDFADVGKEIVDKCRGLPLAIKVVGGVLRMADRKAAAWEEVLSRTTWSMQDLPEEIPPSLLLSYDDLPLHLKQCFAYCSLFPEDYEISRFNLQHLWIAEGFIKKVEGRSLEDSSREYYNELVMRNLLQEFSPLKVHYDRTFCKMHDLLLSLAIFVSHNQYIYLQPKDFCNSGLTRHHHLSFVGNDTKDKVVSQEIKEEYRVRTLLFYRNHPITMVSSDLLNSLRRLRVLDLEGTKIKTLPDSLGTLIHLRFLNVSYTELKELPDSLGALIHLRFLNISHTFLNELPDSIKNLNNLETLQAVFLIQLRSLPMGISQLFNLRCLRVDRLDNMPNGLGNLKNLRILDCFVVNDCISRIGRRYTPNLRELRDLSQLTDLSIHNLERVGSKEEAKEAAIEKKTSLKCLKLHCEQKPRINDEDIREIEKVFAGIKLPQNLTELSIDGFFGKQLLDHVTSDHLRQVTSLELRNCKLLRALPFLGNMGKLQRLEIENAESVVELDSEFLGSSKFPKLQELKLTGMLNLERMFEVEEGAFPCLRELSITNCPQLISLAEGLNHATCLKMLSVRYLDNLKTIENLSSISELTLGWNETLSSVKNLPSLKIMDIRGCRALEDVNEVGKLNYLYIQDDVMNTLPRWLESITPPKKLSVFGSKELVLRTQESVEDQNIIKKCLYAEVRSPDGSKYNSTGSSGASSSSVTITEHVNDFMGEE